MHYKIWVFLIPMSLGLSCAVLISNGNMFWKSGFVTGLIDTPRKVYVMERMSLWQSDCQNMTQQIECVNYSDSKTNLMVLGDSHVVDGYNILRTALPNGYHVMMLGERGCSLNLFEPQSEEKSSCVESNTTINRELLKGKVKTVVVSSRLDEERLNILKKSIEWMIDLDIRVIVLGVGPWFDKLTTVSSQGSITFDDVQRRVQKTQKKGLFQLNEKVRAIFKNEQVMYLDKYSYFCPNDICNVLTKDNKSLVTFDRNHLSLEAGVEYGEYLRSENANLLEAFIQ